VEKSGVLRLASLVQEVRHTDLMHALPQAPQPDDRTIPPDQRHSKDAAAKLKALLAGVEFSFPTADIEQMNREIEQSCLT